MFYDLARMDLGDWHPREIPEALLMSGQDFASLLERAIRASNKEREVKLIEARAEPTD